MTRPLRWYAKWAVKAVTPPILILAAKKLVGGGRRRGENENHYHSQAVTPVENENENHSRPAPPEWEYVPEGWERPVRGWNAGTVAEAYARKWPAYLEAITSPNPLGVHHETAEVTTGDLESHNMLVSFAYVVALAAGGREAVSVLDWGGGFGHYEALARSTLLATRLDWHVKETPPVCAEGRRIRPEVTFHEDDACLDRRYDLVVASGSLHYESDWRSLLARLAAAAGSHLYLARVPVALHHPSFVVLQRPQVHGYDTEYLGWVLDRDELLEAAGLPLAREFLLGARFSAAGAPEDPVEHRSFLFNR